MPIRSSNGQGSCESLNKHDAAGEVAGNTRRSMERGGRSASSAGKRTKKAATRDRSTTSSTIGEEAAVSADQTEHDRAPDAETPFSDAEQQAFLGILVKGASPAVVCGELGVEVDRFWTTCHCDDGFLAAVERAYDALSLNVVSALYRAAIKGSVPAQTFWLRQRKPPLWTPPVEDDAARLAGMSDAELAEACRAEGVDVEEPADG